MFKFHSHAELFGCSVDGCLKHTRGHYCADHARWCKACGEERLAVDLNIDGKCDECVRAEAADDEQDRGPVDDDRPNVTVDGVLRFA